MPTSNGIFYDRRTERWGYRVGNNKREGYKDKQLCARDYTRAFLEHNPKYKPLVEGKPWPEVFKVLGIEV